MLRRKKPKLVLQKLDWPEGSVLTDLDTYYFIKNGRRIPFVSERAFDTWSLVAVAVPEQAMSHIPKQKLPLGFRDGTLIHNIADGKLYLVAGNKLRWITSPDVFDKYGIDYNSKLMVSNDECIQTQGEPLR